MKEIPLTRGQVALVDDADYEMLSRYKWRCNSKGNVYRDTKDQKIYMHWIIGRFLNQIIHLDDNPLNNQRSNLRVGSPKHKNTASQFKGVSWGKTHCRWDVRISVNGQRKYLGFFTDEVEAAKAYDETARKQWGDIAYLNFPNQS